MKRDSKPSGTVTEKRKDTLWKVTSISKEQRGCILTNSAMGREVMCQCSQWRVQDLDALASPTETLWGTDERKEGVSGVWGICDKCTSGAEWYVLISS